MPRRPIEFNVLIADDDAKRGASLARLIKRLERDSMIEQVTVTEALNHLSTSDLNLVYTCSNEVLELVAGLGAAEQVPVIYYQCALDARSPERRVLQKRTEEILDNWRNNLRSRTTIEILDAINAAYTPYEAVGEILRVLKHVTGAQAIGIRLKKDGDYPYFVLDGFSEEHRLRETSLCAPNSQDILECLCGHVLKGKPDASREFFTDHGSFWTGSSKRLIATLGDEAGRLASRGYCVTEGFESMALIPLRTGGETLGLVQICDRRRGFITRSMVSLMEQGAGSVAVALDRVDKAEALRKAIADAVVAAGKLESLHRSAAKLSSAKTPSEVYDEVLSILSGDYGYKWAGVAVVEGQNLRYVKYLGVTLGDHLILPLSGKGVTVRAVRTGKTQFIEDATLDRDYVLLEGIGTPFLSELAVPVTVSGRVALVINLESEQRRGFGEEDRRIVELLALHVGSALTVLDESEKQRDIQSQQTKELLEGAERLTNIIRFDLRGPLQTIKNASYLARQNPQRVDEFTDLIDRGADYINNIVNDLGRISNPNEITKTLENIEDLVEQSIRSTVIPGGVEVVPRLTGGFIALHLDAPKIRRVLDGLIENSVEAMPDGGTLTVSTRLEGSWVNVTIADTGRGIPRRAQRSLFKSLYTTKPHGTGLGLIYSKQVIEAHGGTLILESREGEGTTVSFTLPLKK